MSASCSSRRMRQPARSSSWLAMTIAAALATAAPAFALPTGEQVVSGQVGVARPTAQNMLVQQGTQNAIVNWQGFSIGASEAVRFQQPGASSVILNRVVGNNASEIYGHLSANGQVFLVNPSGVLFGRGAMVDVGGLVASSLAIGNEDFLAGRYRFQGNGAPGPVANQGTLAAHDGGFVALLGGKVNNDGTISARLGTAALAAGNKMTLDFAGDGLVRIAVDEAALAAAVRNQGAVVADGGQAILTARSAEALTQAAVNQTGVIQARTLVERQGRIVLDAGPAGQTLAGGVLDASGKESGQKGGEIQVLGQQVGITGAATLDASGDAGGGAVLVGGDLHGANPDVASAKATWVGPDTTIRADALNQGDGGKVAVWSDEVTRVHGTISARGGPSGGNGGVVETSGKHLETAGLRVDASAPQGKAGNWLLDPNNITIGFGENQNVTDVKGGPPDFDFTSVGTDAFLDYTVINDALDIGTNVSITTGTDLPSTVSPEDGNIEVRGETRIRKTSAAATTLSLNAHNQIHIAEGAQIISTDGPLDIVLNSGFDGNLTSPTGPVQVDGGVTIITNGGDFSIYGQSNPVNGRAMSDVLDGVSMGFGTLIDTRDQNALTTSGKILLRGASTSGAGVRIGDAELLAANGSITIDGQSSSGAGVLLGVEDGTTLKTTSGLVSITGVGLANGSTGVSLAIAEISTVAGGSIDIRGRGDSIGVELDDATVTTTGAGPGRIMVSGQSTGASAGVQIGGTSKLGNIATSGNIIVRATNASAGDSIALGGATQTTGVVNLRPGGVSAAGALTPADADTIEINGATTGFSLSSTELSTIVKTAAALVIGGSSQTGAINVGAATSFPVPVTLQTAGAGSSGIDLSGAVTGPTVTLSSGGPVTQAAPLTASALLLNGTSSGSDFALGSAANTVSRLGIDSPLGGGAVFVNSGALTIGPTNGTGFDSATNTPVALSAPNSVSFGDILVRAGGNLTLAQNVSTIGSDIDLVTTGVLINSTGADLFPGGAGNWRVWADTWVGETRGGLVGTSPFPNLYGCAYPGVCTSSVIIPATGDRFIYVQRPTVTVTADNKARFVGQPNPPLTFTASDLVNGDTAGNALSVSLSTAATLSSPAGQYPIDISATSPEGYAVTTMNGLMGVTPPPPELPITQWQDVITESTLLYDRNAGQQFVCTPTGPLAVPASTVQGSDTLAREWSRVRQRPNLTNCIGVSESGGCDDF
jgi:filamentous hemagglutinin family protein